MFDTIHRDPKLQLVVMIPCLNEEATLPSVLSSIPAHIPGIHSITLLVIDDGSTDKTTEIAHSYGAGVIRHTSTKGLAYSFAEGLEHAVKIGADIIVNTDGDNQYPQAQIAALVKPIIEGKADMVIGDRQTDKIAHFSPFKKKLQKLGSFFIRELTNTEVKDAVSGFRAFSRAAAQQIHVFTDYTYTLETIIAAGKKKLKIVSVPVTTNCKTRESRLMKSMFSYLKISITTIIRVFAIYEPLKTFGSFGTALVIPGAFFILRFIYYFIDGNGNGHTQSLIVGTLLVMVGFQVVLFGIIADLIGFNRKLLEQIKIKVD